MSGGSGDQTSNTPWEGDLPAPKAVRIGDVLLESGAITEAQLGAALERQQNEGSLLGEILVEEGILSPSKLVHTLGQHLGLRSCVLRHGLVDPELLKLVPAEIAHELGVIPMFKIRDELTVAMAEPQSLPTIDRLTGLTGCRIRPVLALKGNIDEFIDKYTQTQADLTAFLSQLRESDVEVFDKEHVDEEAEAESDLAKIIAGSPIVNLVNMAVLTAIRDRASDIHIEPSHKGTRIRYRIDGTLRDLMRPPQGMHAAIASRVKILAKLDIAEKRMPQEGRIRIMAEGREVSLRVSSIPTLLGEKLVIRILDRDNLNASLADLGIRADLMMTITRMLRKPYGLMLVTGPTGSGKSTTLYSALELLSSPERNIVTVEDPVEYQLDLINQIQVQEGLGLSFSKALRSILRQDPDVIMVGEIRDQDTARVATQAAITGHLVLATLHTNDAPGAVERLMDMGIEPYLLSGAINGVIAQRLARTVCPHCATRYYPEENVLEEAGIADEQRTPFRRGLGCQHCHDTGFQGRIGVYEVMEVTPPIRRLVHAGASSLDLREAFRKGGGLSLREEAVLVAKRGATSLEEALRVTRSDDDDLDESAPTEAAA
ncbi:MAG: Flp pilus assembly complex ATPase component TadA [Phycisphaerales bacterium]|nr:Flp pilus assembly complex ATPase component TadA [Phycisphaerales bacterium]